MRLNRFVAISMFLLSPVAQGQVFFDLLPAIPTKPVSELGDSNKWVAIIGDSGTTGAASNKELKPNGLNLASHLAAFAWNSKYAVSLPKLETYPTPERFGIHEIKPMTRVVYSAAEFARAEVENDVMGLNLQSKGSLAVDMPENTSGYMFGHAMGIKAEDIVLTGQDGARVSSIPRQFARLYQMNTANLPPYLIVSFTANDFCDSNVFNDSVEVRKERFRKNLAEAWAESAVYMKAHPQRTQMIILPALEVSNVLSNQALLQQKVKFQGVGKITCAQLREQKDMNGFLTENMVKTLGGMCKSVLLTKPSDTVKLQRIKDIQNAFNEVWKEQVASLQRQYGSKGFDITYLEGVRQVQFEKGDLASDCFHPGAGAHAKIADFILKTLYAK